MRRTLILLGIVAGLVAACGGATATGALPAGATQTGATQTGATQTGATQTTPGLTAVPTNGTAKALDACTLITADEAAAAIGEPVDPGAPPEPGSSSCLFSAQAISINSVEITITSVADFNPDKPSITGLTITKVSGVGDAAYTLSIGPGHIVLNVRKGQATFSVSVLLTSASNDQLLEKEKTLAGLILGRI
jgi:hypothetical protein